MQQFNGKQYLKIDIASNYGLDKKTWKQRLAWYEENKDNLMSFMKESENPALFYAGIKAMQKAEAGEPSGYPISLDATSSGLQILACLTGDRKAAELCNVVNIYDCNEPVRADGYTIVYTRMVNKLGEEGKIKREDTKQAIMTSLYGSQAVPKQVFGEGALLYTFEDTMNESAPAAWELNKAYIDMWDPEALCNSWVLPDNFHVHVKVMDKVAETVHFLNAPYEVYREINQPTDKGRSLGANTTHSIDGMIVREMARRCNYNAQQVAMVRSMVAEVRAGYQPTVVMDNNAKEVQTLWGHYKASGYLSARILEVLDYNNIMLVELEPVEELLASLPAKPFEVITIHDCFRCLPNYGNDLRKQYQLQLYYIARSDLLSFMLSQLLGKHVPITKADPEMYKDILEAEYSLS